MKIGIIGPSKIEYVEQINRNSKELINEVAEFIAKSKNPIFITPDKGSVSEYFAKKYIEFNGKKVFEIIPLDDKEFGLSWVNLNFWEHINCGTWRNQPEKLNEETEALICLGYSVGGLIEIAYTKWFNKKPVYIIKELISSKLPEEINKSLDLKYISVSELKEILK
ncbi:MAG: hypothetical protein NT076_02235 [Candidatus Pacearchaeota archaeon]|nr:hypothetical protein [Candidatus Pacearchaeota archaeon]